jgi:hypothetical protein
MNDKNLKPREKGVYNKTNVEKLKLYLEAQKKNDTQSGHIGTQKDSRKT